MNIEIVAKNVEVDSDLRAFVERQLTKAARFMEDPIDVRVLLQADKHRRIADLHVAHRFGVIQATDETLELREAIRLAVEKASKQAKRSRKKYKDRKRRSQRPAAPEWPVDVMPIAAPGSGSTQRKIVETLRVTIPTMDLETAVEALEASRLGFHVFRDDESGRVNIIYRRDAEHYGLITPEL